MATDIGIDVIPAESNTLRAEEERLRTALAERWGIRTRVASLPGTRAFLVSPMAAGAPAGLVVDRSVTAAERIYLYVHLAAHVALKHNLPLVTIVESRGETTSGDANRHRDAEQLARAMWWGAVPRTESRALWPGTRSRFIRPLLSVSLTRTVLRSVLLLLRRGYYSVRGHRLLDRVGLTAVLRDALCVTAVVSAGPELAASGRGAPRRAGSNDRL